MKKNSEEVGCLCVCVNHSRGNFCLLFNKNLCYISLSASEIPRHVIYRKKADFLISLVTEVCIIGRHKNLLRKNFERKKHLSGGTQKTIISLRVA